MKIKWSIFPKFSGGMQPQALAQFIRDINLDTVNLVIRKGFPVTRENMKSALPQFVKSMAEEGLKITFATAGYMPEEILADEALLAVPAESGIRAFRMGYFSWDKRRTPGECADDARRQMEQLVPLLEKHNIKAVYQVHHGRLFTEAWSVWPLVRDLPPEYVGIMLDPGNQLHEGWQRWEPACHLLGRHLAAMGIKDGLKSTRARAFDWVPCGQGDIDWFEVARALKSVDFEGTFVFMPFYDPDDPAAQKAKLKDEVAYVRAVFAEVEAEKQ